MQKVPDYRPGNLCTNVKGHDFFRIMAASGHKTMEVFKRYNTVAEEELKKLIPGKLGACVGANEKGAEMAPLSS